MLIYFVVVGLEGEYVVVKLPNSKEPTLHNGCMSSMRNVYWKCERNAFKKEDIQGWFRPCLYIHILVHAK